MSNSSSSKSTRITVPFEPNHPAYAHRRVIFLHDSLMPATIDRIADPITHPVAYKDLTPKDVVVEVRTTGEEDTCQAYFRVAVKKTNCFITWADCDPTGTILAETGRIKVKDWDERVNVLSPIAEPAPASNSSAVAKSACGCDTTSCCDDCSEFCDGCGHYLMKVLNAEHDPDCKKGTSNSAVATAVQPRLMLVATYSSESLFDIPKGIDLKAPGWSYMVKRDVLYISGPDGVEIVVHPRYSAVLECNDYKYPDDTNIVTEEDGYNPPEDEDED